MIRYLNIILGDYSCSVNERVANGFTFIGCFIAVISTIFNMILSLHLFLVLITIGISILTGGAYFLTRFKGYYVQISWVIIWLMIFVIIPLLWIFNGGSYGGGQYFSLIFGMVIAILSRGYLRLFYLILYLVEIVVLLLIEQQFPEIIKGYPSQLLRTIDIMFSLVVVVISGLGLFLIYMSSYEHERHRVLNYERSIHHLDRIDDRYDIFTESYFLKRFQEEVLRIRRYQRALSIVMIQINLSHQGDQFQQIVMKQVIMLVRELYGVTALVSCSHRNQREGLLILLPERVLDESIKCSKDLLVKVRDKGSITGISFSINIGVVAWHHNRIEEVLEILNHRVYLATQRGENQIVCDDHGVYQEGD